MGKVVVTGGASFIGSHLVERLLWEGHEVAVIDNCSSGDWGNLKAVAESPNLHMLGYDLLDIPEAPLCNVFCGSDVIYHLAATHGGRGFVELEQVQCSENFAIDQRVFQACLQAEVPRIVCASSGCIYPLNLQRNTLTSIYLKESDAGPPYEPDGLYGMAKLAGELTLREMSRERGIDAACCRFFTVFGPRVKENHAIGSFIARAFIRQDPWEVWGDGTQIRNWTYVDDIVDGMLLAATLPGYNAVNLGTTERVTVREAVELTIHLANEMHYGGDYRPIIKHDMTKPVGPMNRVADNNLYLSLGGKPPLGFEEGLRRTVQWYFESHDRDQVSLNLERLLVARK